MTGCFIFDNVKARFRRVTKSEERRRKMVRDAIFISAGVWLFFFLVSLGPEAESMGITVIFLTGLVVLGFLAVFD